MNLSELFSELREFNDRFWKALQEYRECLERNRYDRMFCILEEIKARFYLKLFKCVISELKRRAQEEHNLELYENLNEIESIIGSVERVYFEVEEKEKEQSK